jgi:hypothetical protein
MRRFRELLKPLPGDRILDVGGSPGLWLDDATPWQDAQITILNVDPAESFVGWRSAGGHALPDRWTYVQGDGRKLPYADGQFDIVFSNSVLEHVGDWADQQAFAQEIARVGKRYWVQTPNRHFPIEPHFNFPGLQFLPLPLAGLIGRVWPFSFHKRYGYGSAAEIRASLRSTRLVTRAELRRLFPNGTILRERFAGLDKSFVVFYAEEPRRTITT